MLDEPNYFFLNSKPFFKIQLRNPAPAILVPCGSLTRGLHVKNQNAGSIIFFNAFFYTLHFIPLLSSLQETTICTSAKQYRDENNRKWTDRPHGGTVIPYSYSRRKKCVLQLARKVHGTAVMVSTAVEKTPLFFLSNFPGGKKTKKLRRQKTLPVGLSGSADGAEP